MFENSTARSRAAKLSMPAISMFFALAFGGAAAYGAESGGTAAPASSIVTIDNFAFSPKVLTVPAGTEVEWLNKDDEPHTVVYGGEEKLFKSPPLDTKDKFSFVFRKPGIYTYYCSVHPHMTATIIVQ